MEPPRKKLAKTTPEERARVLEAYDNGEDWLAVAKANGVSRTPLQSSGHRHEAWRRSSENCENDGRDHDRAPEGERAVYTGPINQGQNLQIQCSVANGPGLVEFNIIVGKIDMDMNASSLLDTYIAALKWADSSDVFRNKKIVLVIDNAPAHERSEDLLAEWVVEHRPPLSAHRLAILRLAPYSPMCNRIEGCFSVVKAAVKRFVSANIERLNF